MIIHMHVDPPARIKEQGMRLPQKMNVSSITIIYDYMTLVILHNYSRINAGTELMAGK